MSNINMVENFIKQRLISFGEIRAYDRNRKSTIIIIGMNKKHEVFIDLQDGEIKVFPISYVIKNCHF